MPLPALIASALEAPTEANALRLADAALTMHAALERVALLWGPCPGGGDDAAIYAAGPEYGRLADLRAVERGLAAVEG